MQNLNKKQDTKDSKPKKNIFSVKSMHELSFVKRKIFRQSEPWPIDSINSKIIELTFLFKQNH